MNIKPIKTEQDYEATLAKIMNYRRKLTLTMIRKLHDGLHIPTENLIQDYSIKQAS